MTPNSEFLSETFVNGLGAFPAEFVIDLLVPGRGVGVTGHDVLDVVSLDDLGEHSKIHAGILAELALVDLEDHEVRSGDRGLLLDNLRLGSEFAEFLLESDPFSFGLAESLLEIGYVVY